MSAGTSDEVVSGFDGGGDEVSGFVGNMVVETMLAAEHDEGVQARPVGSSAERREASGVGQCPALADFEAAMPFSTVQAWVRRLIGIQGVGEQVTYIGIQAPLIFLRGGLNIPMS